MKSLECSHGKMLYEIRRALTSNFKTGCKYGYQPISLNHVSYEYFCIYWLIARPAVCERLEIDMTAANDPLFLNFNGKREKLIGHHIIQFFKQKIGLSVNTTTIRALVEMEAKRLNRKGLLSEHEQEAIANVSGHSRSSTVRDYYLYQDREADSRDAAVLFQRLHEERNGGSPGALTQNSTSVSPARLQGHVSTPTVEASANTTSTNVFEGSAIKWGANHPCGHLTGYAIKWTDEERAYIGMVVQEEKARNDGTIPREICAIIKKRVHEDVDAHAIFHAHHTLDVTRIRNGYYGYINSVDGNAKKRRNVEK
jgi:hypothetical protein